MARRRNVDAWIHCNTIFGYTTSSIVCSHYAPPLELNVLFSLSPSTHPHDSLSAEHPCYREDEANGRTDEDDFRPSLDSHRQALGRELRDNALGKVPLCLLQRNRRLVGARVVKHLVGGKRRELCHGCVEHARSDDGADRGLLHEDGAVRAVCANRRHVRGDFVVEAQFHHGGLRGDLADLEFGCGHLRGGDEAEDGEQEDDVGED